MVVLNSRDQQGKNRYREQPYNNIFLQKNMAIISIGMMLLAP